MDKIEVLIDDLLKLTKSGEITWKPKDQERVVCEDLRQVRCYVYFSKDYLYLAEKSWDVDFAVQFGDPKNPSLKALKEEIARQMEQRLVEKGLSDTFDLRSAF